MQFDVVATGLGGNLLCICLTLKISHPPAQVHPNLSYKGTNTQMEIILSYLCRIHLPSAWFKAR